MPSYLSGYGLDATFLQEAFPDSPALHSAPMLLPHGLGMVCSPSVSPTGLRVEGGLPVTHGVFDTQGPVDYLVSGWR